MSDLQMSQFQQERALVREAKRLGASSLLFAMAVCCLSANGYESALRCLREGVAQGI